VAEAGCDAAASLRPKPRALRKSGQRRKAVIAEQRSSNEPEYL